MSSCRIPFADPESVGCDTIPGPGHHPAATQPLTLDEWMRLRCAQDLPLGVAMKMAQADLACGLISRIERDMCGVEIH